MLIDAEQPLNLPTGDGPLVNYFIMAWQSWSTVELRGVLLPTHHSHPDDLVNKAHRWASHSWMMGRKFNERHTDKTKTEEREGNTWRTKLAASTTNSQCSLLTVWWPLCNIMMQSQSGQIFSVCVKTLTDARSLPVVEAQHVMFGSILHADICGWNEMQTTNLCSNSHWLFWNRKIKPFDQNFFEVQTYWLQLQLQLDKQFCTLKHTACCF